MLNLIRMILGHHSQALVLNSSIHADSEDAIAAAAASARQRLLDQGLFQVELDAQAEINERVRAAKATRESRTGARVAA
jgi:hypothetical protein